MKEEPDKKKVDRREMLKITASVPFIHVLCDVYEDVHPMQVAASTFQINYDGTCILQGQSD